MKWHVDPIEAAKLRIPGKSKKWYFDMLCSVTAFPFNKPYESLRQLIQFKWLSEQGLSRCLMCGDPFMHKSGRVWIDQCCDKCEYLLRMKEG